MGTTGAYKGAFKSVRVQPSHGTRSALITWEYNTGTPPGVVTLERSENPVTDFAAVSVNEHGDTHIVDTDYVVVNSSTTIYYRLTYRHPDHPTSISDSFTAYNYYSRKEFAVLRECIRRIVLNMRTASGRPVLVLQQFQYGKTCSCVDVHTGQSVGRQTCDLCYGTGLHKGFADPLQSYIRFRTPRTKQKQEDKIFTTDQEVYDFEAPGIPEINAGDLIIDPLTDERYVVDTGIVIKRLKDKLPLLINGKVYKLPTNDVRYRIKL